MRDWLRFLRAPFAPTAAWDVLACFALALTAANRPVSSVRPLDALLLVLTSLCVYGFGMGLNDLADRKRDVGGAPDRPLPSGAISLRAATFVVVLLGALALALGGGPAGSREAVALALGLAALYDLLLKRWVVPGVLAMGGVRFANGALAVWPLVHAGEAPWTTMLAPATLGLYAAAITLWSTTEESDIPTLGIDVRRLAARALGVVAFGGAGALAWILSGRPGLGVVVALGVVTSLGFARTPRKGPAKRQVLEMLLGLYFLSMVLASGGDGGSLVANIGSLVFALLLIYVTQRGVRALRT